MNDSPKSPAGSPPLKVGVLLSGSGRTLQNLLDRAAEGRLALEAVAVVADRENAFGLERARRAGIPTLYTKDPGASLAFLDEHGAQACCLAGYLRLLPIPETWRGRVLNIHPSLLPRHGGKGCYGDRVHARVLEAGDTESGCTVHLCDDRYDTGPVLVQKRVPVLPDDTVATLAARVFEAECVAYPEAIELWRRQHLPD